jgi:hypothetical protein
VTDLVPAPRPGVAPDVLLVGAARTYGAKLPINPYTGLLDEVQWRAGHVAWLRDRLQGLSPDELWVTDDRGNLRDSPTLRRYDKERELFDRACKLAIDAGIAERYVQLAELQGATLYRLLHRALDEVGADAELRRAFGAALRRAFELEREQSGTRVDVLDTTSAPVPVQGWSPAP